MGALFSTKLKDGASLPSPNAIQVIAQDGSARVVETHGVFEVSMYGFHVQTFINKAEALACMVREAKSEKRYAYK